MAGYFIGIFFSFIWAHTLHIQTHSATLLWTDCSVIGLLIDQCMPTKRGPFLSGLDFHWSHSKSCHIDLGAGTNVRLCVDAVFAFLMVWLCQGSWSVSSIFRRMSGLWHHELSVSEGLFISAAWESQGFPPHQTVDQTIGKDSGLSYLRRATRKTRAGCLCLHWPRPPFSCLLHCLLHRWIWAFY